MRTLGLWSGGASYRALEARAWIFGYIRGGGWRGLVTPVLSEMQPWLQLARVSYCYKDTKKLNENVTQFTLTQGLRFEGGLSL